MSDLSTTVAPVFCWLELVTTDAASAKSFYEKILGWKYRDVPMGPGMTYTLLDAPSGEVGGLYQMMPEQLAKGAPAHWLPYVAVASADESLAKAQELGGTLIAGPFDVSTHGRMAVIKDPGDAVFALWQAKEHNGATPAGGPGTHCWREVNTRHFDACGEFYSKLFGWTLEPVPGIPTRYSTMHWNGQPVCGMLEMTKQWEGIPSSWTVYFHVADTDATVTAVSESGGTVCGKTFDTPYGRMAIVRDPAGATFAVIRLQAAASA